jgi:hypothetical protein
MCLAIYPRLEVYFAPCFRILQEIKGFHKELGDQPSDSYTRNYLNPHIRLNRHVIFTQSDPCPLALPLPPNNGSCSGRHSPKPLLVLWRFLSGGTGAASLGTSANDRLQRFPQRLRRACRLRALLGGAESGRSFFKLKCCLSSRSCLSSAFKFKPDTLFFGGAHPVLSSRGGRIAPAGSAG